MYELAEGAVDTASAALADVFSSQVVLVLGVLGIFAGVMAVVGSFVLTTGAQQSGVSRSLAAVEALRAAPQSLRQQELEVPFAERVLGPSMRGITSLGRRLTPADQVSRIKKKLDLAGNPAGWDVDRIVSLKVLLTVVGLSVTMLVCLLLDHQMQALADQARAIYTRYADDLTFSFAGPPPAEFLEQVRNVILFQSFKINEAKLRLQPRLEQPEITGLVIGRGPLPTLSKAWLRRLKEEVRILRWLLSEAVRERGIFHAYVFDRFRQSVRGQVEFVGFVLGKEDRMYRKLVGKVG